nr:hypothetical protein [uncultured Butyrivibrio sp.]
MTRKTFEKSFFTGVLCTCVALFVFLFPGNAVRTLATNSANNTLSQNSGLVNTPIDQSPYWPSIKQAIEGYTDDVYIPEDTARTLWNGTNGNGTNTPTVSGKVNGVTYKAGQVIPSTTFNALYYYLNYKDVRDGCGANPQTLVDNWVMFGSSTTPARVVTKMIVRDGYNDSTLTEYGSSSYEYIVPNAKNTTSQSNGMTVIPGEVHSNGGMNREQEIQARSVANQIAQHVFNQVRTLGGGTQIEMVAYATGIVQAYCNRGTYTTSGKIYRTAYGVFIGGEYSCAGSTRALGLVLDYLDVLCQNWNKTNNSNNYGPLKWVHKNANKWDDQWCQIVCDYHEAYADPIGGWAGYGKHPNEGGKKQDYQNYFSFSFESDIITTRPPLVDGQYSVSPNAPDKNKNLNK